MKARLKLADGGEKTADAKIIKKDDRTVVYLEKEKFSKDVEYVDFLYDYFVKNTGDEGYFITDMCLSGTAQTFFKEREDTESVNEFSFVTCYGMNEGKTGILAIITGMQYDFGMVVGVKNGVYYTYPRFYIDGDMPYDDIRVEFYKLADGSYSAMARKYREYKLKNGCVPLKERAEKDARLKKAADSIEVRVRQGWKPAPSPSKTRPPKPSRKCTLRAILTAWATFQNRLEKRELKTRNFALSAGTSAVTTDVFRRFSPLTSASAARKSLKTLSAMSKPTATALYATTTQPPRITLPTALTRNIF